MPNEFLFNKQEKYMNTSTLTGQSVHTVTNVTSIVHRKALFTFDYNFLAENIPTITTFGIPGWPVLQFAGKDFKFLNAFGHVLILLSFILTDSFDCFGFGNDEGIALLTCTAVGFGDVSLLYYMITTLSTYVLTDMLFSKLCVATLNGILREHSGGEQHQQQTDKLGSHHFLIKKWQKKNRTFKAVNMVVNGGSTAGLCWSDTPVWLWLTSQQLRDWLPQHLSYQKDEATA